MFIEDFVREREIQQLIYKRQAIDSIRRETGSTLSRQESQSGFADLDVSSPMLSFIIF